MLDMIWEATGTVDNPACKEPPAPIMMGISRLSSLSLFTAWVVPFILVIALDVSASIFKFIRSIISPY
jgi:hypothetical protein